MRKNRKFSKAECLSYLEEYMCSSQNHSEFEREKGLKRTTISRWLRIFGIEDKPSPIMSKKLSQTEHDVMDVYGSTSLTAWTVVNIMQRKCAARVRSYTRGR